MLLLVTLGLVLVTPSFDLQDDATIGLAWAILSGLTFALFTLINRRAAARIPAQQVACWENLFVVVLTLPFAYPAITQLGALDWVWMAMLGILCTALSIGRASCRERVCQYVLIRVVDVLLKKKQ